MNSQQLSILPQISDYSQHSELPERSVEERSQAIEEHMELVYKLARKYISQFRGRVDYEELVAWGVTGLIEAMDRYTPGGPAAFQTFAYYRVRGAMMDGVAKMGPLSRNGYRLARKDDNKHAVFILECNEDTVSGDRSQNPELLLEQKKSSELLHKALERLPEAEKKLVERHYFADQSLCEAGQELGMSKSWACRKHARALAQLRSELEKIAF